MFISSEHWDEEVLPLATLLVFSLSEDFDEPEEVLPLQPEIAGHLAIKGYASNAKFDSQTQQNKKKSVETTVSEICRRSGYDLRAAKIISNRILMVISSRANPKTKFGSVVSRINLESFYTEILSTTRELKKLEEFYCLWKSQQIEAAIDFVKHGKGNFEFDVNR